MISLVMPFCAWAEEQSVSHPGSVEALFVQWINEARANPWDKAKQLGLNVTKLRDDVGEAVAGQWDKGLPPLKWNRQLTSAAAFHVQDMLARLYYSHVDPEGVGPKQRMEAAGYEPIFCGESLGGLAFINIIPAEQAARIICDALLKNALLQGSEGAPLLDPLLKDIGLYLDGGQLLLGDNQYNVYILVCDLGRAQRACSDGQGVLWGHVYQDLNGNGRYDKGEGIQGSLIIISGWWSTVGFSPSSMMRVRDQRISGREGSYLFELMPGNYSLTVEQNGQEVLELDDLSIDPLACSLGVDLVIPGPSPS